MSALQGMVSNDTRLLLVFGWRRWKPSRVSPSKREDSDSDSDGDRDSAGQGLTIRQHQVVPPDLDARVSYGGEEHA